MDQVISECYTDFLARESIQKILAQSLNVKEFIIDVKCAVDELESAANITCRKSVENESIRTFQGNSVCWTLFHQSIVTSQISRVQVPSGYAQSALLIADKGVSLSVFNQSINPREVIRLLVNLTTVVPVAPDEPNYGMVAAHDPHFVKQIRRSGMKIHPGKYYEISIEDHETVSLPPPYATMCFDYVSAHIKRYEKRPKTNPFALALSSNDCFIGCMGINTMQQPDCLCWPPEIPFVAGDRKVNPLLDGECFLCNWITFAKSKSQINSSNDTAKTIMHDALSCFRNCSASFEAECHSECPKGCRELRMKTTHTDITWPSDEEISGAEGDDKIQQEALRKCCSIISIKYAGDDRILYTAQAKYEFIEFISYIGGIVGMWLGFTFVGLIDYAVCFVKFVKRLLRPHTDSSIHCVGVHEMRDRRHSMTDPMLLMRRSTRERLPWIRSETENLDNFRDLHSRRNSHIHDLYPALDSFAVRPKTSRRQREKRQSIVFADTFFPKPWQGKIH